MTINRDLSINIIADLADYKARMMKEFPEMTDAAAQKATEKMQARFTALRFGDVTKQSKFFETMQKGSARTAEAGSKLATVIGSISPEFGALSSRASAASAAIGGLSGLTAASATIMGGAAVAVAGLAVWYSKLKKELDAAEAASAKMNERAAAASTAASRFAEMEIDVAVATGQMTEENAKLIRSEREVRGVVDALTVGWRERMAELEKYRNQFGWTSKSARIEYEALAEKVAQVEEKGHDWALVQGYIGSGTKKNTELTKEQTEAIRAQEEAMRTAEATAKVWLRALDVEAQGEAAVKLRENLEGIAQAESQGALEAIPALNAKALASKQYTAQLAEQTKLQREADAQFKADIEKTQQDLEDVAKAHKEEVLGVVGAVGDLGAQYMSTAQNGLQSIIEARQESGKNVKALFALQKSAAIAEVAFNTASAVSKVWGQTGLLGVFAQAAPIAMGVTQAAIIAAQKPPSFHSGGSLDQRAMAPDERMTRVTKNEIILSNAQARAGQAQPIVVVQQYQHRAFDRFVIDNVRRRGLLAQAIAGSR